MKQSDEHPAIVSIDVRPSDLARVLSQLSYDWLAVYVGRLAMELEKNATSDSDHGRTRLAQALSEASEHLFKAQQSLALAWNICQPHSKGLDEKGKSPTGGRDL